MRGSEGQAIPCKIYVSGHCLGRWIVGVASFQVGWVWSGLVSGSVHGGCHEVSESIWFYSVERSTDNLYY